MQREAWRFPCCARILFSSAAGGGGAFHAGVGAAAHRSPHAGRRSSSRAARAGRGGRHGDGGRGVRRARRGAGTRERANIIQVNARDLASLAVDRRACLALAAACPPQEGELWIAACGMSCRSDLEEAAKAGFRPRSWAPRSWNTVVRGRRCALFLAGRRRMRIKICGMSEQRLIDEAAALGVEFCGFVFTSRARATCRRGWLRLWTRTA